MKKRALCPLSGVHLTIKPAFAHVTSVYFATSKVIKEAEILQEGFSLIFGSSDIWSDAAIVQCIFVGANSNIQFVQRLSSF